MAAPLVTQAQIISALQSQFRAQLPGTVIEVFDTWPSDDTNVRYGVYVADLHQTNRTPYQLGVRVGGSVYLVTDEVEITYISFRDDVNNTTVMNIISDLVAYQASGPTRPLFDGYHQRTYTQDEEYGSRAMRHRWVLSLERLEFL